MGGGMKSTAYVGLLKAFEENNIRPHSIIGSSGGAVVGAAYAFGKSPKEILHHFETFHPLTIFNPFRILSKRGIDYSPWEQHAAKMVPMNSNIEQANIALAIHAVDAKTQESVYIKEGSAVKAVIASTAALERYEYNGHQYVDGEYDPETGVEEHKKMGAEIVIVCTTKSANNTSLVPIEITMRNALHSDMELHEPDAVINILLQRGSLLSKRYIQDHYQAGYKTALEFIESLSA